jgi:hypothetical protein
MPGDVFKLRKTMLKTRDMLDVFSTVYSTQSSLDDYSDEKHNDALLILNFEPWKKVRILNYRHADALEDKTPKAIVRTVY